MNLLFRIERYLRRSKLPPTSFGRQVANDPRLVGDLRRGRQAGPRMVARIERYLDAEEG